MSKWINSTIFLLIIVLMANMALATTVYNTNIGLNNQIDTPNYRDARLTADVGTAIGNTRVSHKQVNGAIVFRPGATSTALSTIGTSPTGYGWATGLNISGDVPAGLWEFKVNTKNNRHENTGYIGVNVFKFCSGVNTRLFYVQGTVNVMGTATQIAQIIQTNQPAFSMENCKLKFEYWLTGTNVIEDNNNDIKEISTTQFYVTFPTPPTIITSTTTTTTTSTSTSTTSTSTTVTTSTSTTSTVLPGATTTVLATTTILLNMSGCQDADADSYYAAGCGGNDCNDNNMLVHPNAAESCNNIDDDCDGAIDDGVTRACGSNIGDCQPGIETCRNGAWGLCNAISPGLEACDYRDNDCDGSVDEDDVCVGKVKPPCVENWVCGEWTSCLNVQKSSRECRDTSNCGTSTSKPLMTKSCIAGEQNATIQPVSVFVKENTVFATGLLVTIIGLSALGWYLSADKKRKSLGKLLKLVKNAKKQGYDDKKIIEVLKQKGWPDEQIDEIFKGE